MLNTETIPAIIGSSVISAWLTSIYTKASSDKNIRIENITKERKDWRENIRSLVVQTTIAVQNQDIESLQKIESEFTARLNPNDSEDEIIIQLIRELQRKSECKNTLWMFNSAVACLLKHDWERSKLESSTNVSPQTLAFASLCGGFALYLINSIYAFCDITLMETTNIFLASSSLFIIFATPCVINFIFSNNCHWSTSENIFPKLLCYIANKPYREEICKIIKRLRRTR